MGNTTSCTSYVITGGTVKVIAIDGTVEEYMSSIRVAEVMLENPGMFVCDSSHLKVGTRVPGIAADEELACRRLYFILPMDMLYSVLTEEEMVCLTYRAASAVRRGSSTRKITRIFPLLSEFCLFPADQAKPLAHQQQQALKSGKVERMMMRQRSWMPSLDTIDELP
ncbi:hypothetical protein J5N97_027883 [Dioscorea zingiberensis]|uniref:Uncharacterized protein n=1 Tax=Dioscorea zingiberensis TaxID=325984 RepID=A0A9D5H4E3_9LILI|nr:hypothetical protein J5N97_027883 [Dioscorea zingiberensis]